LAPFARNFNSRQDSLLPLHPPTTTLTTTDLPHPSLTLVEGSFEEKIIGFEVFKHYMAVLQERDQNRLLKSKYTRTPSYLKA